MEKILITGSNGFIGSHLVDSCLNKGKRVYALDKPNFSLKNLFHYVNKKEYIPGEKKINFLGENIQIPTNNDNLYLLECNIKNKDLVDRLILNIKPDYLFHFAAQSFVIPSWENPVETFETNVNGTINLFESIKRHQFKTRVVVACSSAEYGTTTDINRPLKEIDPLMAVHPYGISKIATELLARQYFLNFGIDIVNLRFFNQTGPRKVGDACSDFISKVAKIDLGFEDPIIKVGNLDSYRDFTGIKDTIRAIWLATKYGKSGEVYNICSSKKTRIRDLLNITLSFSNNKIKVIENTPEKMRPIDEDIILGDNSKIRKQLGFKTVQSIESILKDMYDYWVNNLKKLKSHKKS